MKVYFTASTSNNGELMPIYKKIVLLIKQHRLIITSGEQITSNKLLKEDAKLSSKEIFEREMRSIDQADIVVAETSKPSLGVGGEIVYALTQNKPVLALINTKYEDTISPMLTGNPSDNLYTEFYNESNLKFKLNEFVSYIQKVQKRRGKLIVIDGGDGSGKTTQAKLLVVYLKKEKIPVKYIDFPQYYHSFHGKVVAKFLRGELGKMEDVSPYLISLAYALDRASVKKEIEDFLGRGGYIIANRYATSSMAHQGAKFTNEQERKEFLKWQYDLEYKVHKIPRENQVIYLYVPWQTGLELTKHKDSRGYLCGKKQDIAEKDLNHRKASEEMYLDLAKKYKHWIRIDCMENGILLPPDEIHLKILQAIPTIKKKNP